MSVSRRAYKYFSARVSIASAEGGRGATPWRPPQSISWRSITAHRKSNWRSISRKGRLISGSLAPAVLNDLPPRVTMSEPLMHSTPNMKKLILCCDGTWLDSDNSYKPPSVIPWNPDGNVAQPSNITHLSQALEAIDSQGRSQVVYYQAGLGTGWTVENRILGGALGVGISQNVREAYNFLACNYVPGDEIYLLGFSRGAFTARSVGGLITSIGLLNKDGLQHLGVIFDDWLNSGDRDRETLAAATEDKGGVPGFRIKAKSGDADFLAEYAAELQRLELTQKVAIDVVGVFETVGALGIPSIPLIQHLGLSTLLGKLRFWNAELNSNYKYAFQALALDERRASYVPGVWNKSSNNDVSVLKQVWFPGVHSNIGGSLPGNGIGMLTLAWMMSQLTPFLDFKPGYIKTVYLDGQRYIRGQKNPQNVERKYGGWGDGLIPNSARFPRSLGGVKTRTPGAYHQIDRATSRSLPDRPKLNTGEMVHASVRARVEDKGTKVGGSDEGYFPEALKQWSIKQPQAPLSDAQWIYEGAQREARIDELVEDKLGVIELELLELFKSGDGSLGKSTDQE